MNIRHVFVVGAGTMGNGIAQVAATSGYHATCMDVEPAALEKARAAVDRSTARLLEKGTITAEQRAAAQQIAYVKSLEGAGSAEIIVEAATEDPELKLKIFRELDGAASPNAILATNTSSISITKIAAATKRPAQVIGMHFMNPVPLMKLVEVIRGLQTSQETFDATMALARALGKEPVPAADFPGFIANRILMPMINEAVYALMEGVGEASDIDAIMKMGANHPMGPLALADLIGLDTCLEVMNVLQQGLGDSKYRPCPLLRKHVEAGYLGKKTGRGFYTYEKAV